MAGDKTTLTPAQAAAKAEQDAKLKEKLTDSKVRWNVHATQFGASDVSGQTVIPNASTPCMTRCANEGAEVPKILGRIPGSSEETLELLQKNNIAGIDLCGAALSHPDLRTLSAVLRSNPPELKYLDVRGSLDVRGKPLYPKEEIDAAAAELEEEHVKQHGAFKVEAEDKGEEGGEEETEDASLEKLKERFAAESAEEFTDKAAAFKILAKSRLNRTDLLLAALEENKTLTDLSLAANGLGTKDDGSRTFKQLRKVRAVVDDHPALLRLDISDNKMGPKATGTIVKGLVNNIHIAHLDISGNDIGVEDEGEEDEGDAEDDPDFGDALVGPVGVASLLKKNKFVRHLRMRDNGLKGPAPESVPEMPNPEPEEEGGEPPPIPEDWDALTDDHKEDPFCKMILPLKTYHRITTLDLSKNELGAGGAFVIASVLRGNKSVTSLDLSENGLGMAGVKVLAQQLVKGTGNLKRLALARNDFAGLKCKKGGKKWRAQKEAVEELCLFLSSEKNNVVDLDLAYNNLGAEFGALVVSALAKAPSGKLQMLDLSMNLLGGTESGCYEADAAQPLCDLLTALPLRSVKLQWNFLQEDGARSLATALGTDNVAKNLISLDVSRNYLGTNGLEAVCTSISGGHSLAELRLAANGRCEPAAAAVAEMVGRAKSLRVLDVTDLALGTEGGHVLLTAAASSTLQHIFIATNEIGAGGAEALGSALQNPSVRAVDAADNDFGSGSIKTVLRGLNGNSTLRSLKVWGGEHGTSGAPTKLAVTEHTAQLLASGNGSALLYLDLGLPVALSSEQATGKVTESLFQNLNAATFSSAQELVARVDGCTV